MKQHRGPIGSGCSGSCSTPLLLSPGIRVWSDRRTRPAGSLFPVSQDDLDDIRQATTASFNALRADFSDLRDEVGRGFSEMRGKLDASAAGQQRIAELIESLIDQQNG